jgi:hypothetical protein
MGFFNFKVDSEQNNNAYREDSEVKLGKDDDDMDHPGWKPMTRT